MMRCGGADREIRSRGQSTLEYLLVAVAVLLAVVFGVNKFFAPQVKARMDDAGDAIDKAGTELDTAVGPLPDLGGSGPTTSPNG